MAESHNQVHESDDKEAKGCGLFNFLGKKEEKPANDVIMTESKGKNEEKEEDKHTLMEELNRSHSHSSSSSEEEVEEGGERKKKKKKKSLKETIKETVSSEKEDNGKEPSTDIPAKFHETECCEATMQGEEKKLGFLEKMKDKLPGQHKKTEEGVPIQHAVDVTNSHSAEGEEKEKKGILEKIMDKLPGSHGHKNGEDEVKHKEK